MSKKILIILGVILVVGGGIGAYYFLTNKDKEAQSNSTTQATNTDTSEKAQAELKNGTDVGTYVVYSEEAFNNTKGDRLLFFYASWCPQCRELEDSIKNNDIPANVTIFEVDYDTKQDLRKKYGVTQQTTVVRVDENGNEVKKFVAYDEPTLDAVTQNLLN